MSTLEFTLIRDVRQPEYTLGRLLVNDTTHVGYTCEDTDRELEAGGVKVPGKTAIPPGRYRLTASMSNRFKRVMPEIREVPQFSGVRIHGGNTAADTEGCPLLGQTRAPLGVQNCADVNARLLRMILDAEQAGGRCWITVR